MLRSVGWLSTDVSGLPVGSIFKVQVLSLGHLTLEMGLIGSPETSVLNQPKARNIPEDDRFQPQK
jgi:hypothetical protein